MTTIWIKTKNSNEISKNVYITFNPIKKNRKTSIKTPKKNPKTNVILSKRAERDATDASVLFSNDHLSTFDVFSASRQIVGHSQTEFEPGQDVSGLPSLHRQTLSFVPETQSIAAASLFG